MSGLVSFASDDLAVSLRGRVCGREGMLAENEEYIGILSEDDRTD